MEGLIFLVILIPVILFILLLVVLNRTNDNKRLLEDLYEQIKHLREETKQQEPVLKTEIISDPKTESLSKKYLQKESIEEKPLAVVPEKPVQAKPQEPVIPAFTPIDKMVVEEPTPAPASHLPEFQKQEREKDLEKYIGENLISKIGIAILVLGIAFFVKYAIDKNWVNEAGRVIIGLVSGGILIGLAHYFRNTYRSFSSVLVGGGLTVFYFSIAFAFHQYHLIGQTPAFIFMVIISAGGVLLSLFYNRQELAILATIGGFVTPFLVATGQENYLALFSYLGILNTGLMVLAWFKRWPAINSIALLFTTFIFAGWLIRRINFEQPGPLPAADALLFATLFYFLFMAMNIINTLRLKSTFTAFDFIILLSTNFLYFIAGVAILSTWEKGQYDGWFTLGLGLFNGLLALTFQRIKTADKNFVALLTGLSLSFISFWTVMQFDPNFIVLYWSAEMVILYWLYRKTNLGILRWASGFLIILTLGGLLYNWADVYFTETLPVIFNKGFITTISVALAFYLFYYQLTKIENENRRRRLILIIAIVVTYLAGGLEILFQSGRYTDPVAVLFLETYSFAFVFLLLQFFIHSPLQNGLRFGLTIGCYAFYIFFAENIFSLSEELVTKGNGALFSLHWVASILLLLLLFQLATSFYKRIKIDLEEPAGLFTWIFAPAVVVFFSFELHHLMLWMNAGNLENWAWWENLYYKAGLTMLWSICSFAAMWWGMRRNFRTPRIFSLVLFTVTLVKLFVFDIRNIPPGGKIVAFILLGILLLSVSFMYQRLKKIIIE